ncbi:MAG: tRNA epoxyqueuosine(34) reductase QueG [Bacteroidetes bacterium]|nr:tRNA epoxyqueuosine(34) reductase QueG [Bacteroidota bacterium]
MKKDIKEYIIKEGNKLGFPIVKFAKEEPLTNETRHLNHWLSLKYDANMTYMQRNLDKMESIKLLFKNAKTIILFAYPHIKNIVFNSKLKVGKYAIVSDYHKVIREKLNTISESILNKFNVNSMCFVDSSSILEKQWAVRSGVGWQGKNSLIINEILGSYFNIGVMIVDVEIEADNKIKNQCGDCNLCIKSCPTGAIVLDKVIDCRRCITRFTNEKTDNIPEIIKIAMKKTGYIFGCDICQDVCTFNRKFRKNKAINYDILNKIEYMSENDFNKTFAESPIIRTGYKRILEHIKIVLSI